MPVPFSASQQRRLDRTEHNGAREETDCPSNVSTHHTKTRCYAPQYAQKDLRCRFHNGEPRAIQHLFHLLSIGVRDCASVNQPRLCACRSPGWRTQCQSDYRLRSATGFSAARCAARCAAHCARRPCESSNTSNPSDFYRIFKKHDATLNEENNRSQYSNAFTCICVPFYVDIEYRRQNVSAVHESSTCPIPTPRRLPPAERLGARENETSRVCERDVSGM